MTCIMLNRAVRYEQTATQVDLHLNKEEMVPVRDLGLNY